MNSWHGTIFFVLHLNFVFGGKKWTVLQYEGIDDLYVQTRITSERMMKPNYAMLKGICASLIRNPSFRAVVKKGKAFRSTIQGEVEKVEIVPPHVLNNECRRYSWKTPNYEFITDIYACATPRDERIYVLSHGYEQDHLFFLFVYDNKTNVLQLAAYIVEEVVPLMWSSKSSYMKNRKTYIDRVLKKHLRTQDIFKDVDPVCELNAVDKLRLCAVVLNSSHYKSRYEFPVNVHPTDSECKEVLLVGRKSRKILSTDMYPCPTRTFSRPSEDVVIYISRNYKDYEVNSYIATGKNNDGVTTVKFEKSFKNIFFVEELYTTDGTMKTEHKLARKNEHDKGGTSSLAVNKGHDPEVKLVPVTRTLSSELPKTEATPSAVHENKDDKSQSTEAGTTVLDSGGTSSSTVDEQFEPEVERSSNTESSASVAHGDKDNESLSTEERKTVLDSEGTSSSTVYEWYEVEGELTSVSRTLSKKLSNTAASPSAVPGDKDKKTTNTEALSSVLGGNIRDELPNTEILPSVVHEDRKNKAKITEISSVQEDGDNKLPHTEASSSVVHEGRDEKNDKICEEAIPSTPEKMVPTIPEWDGSLVWEH